MNEKPKDQKDWEVAFHSAVQTSQITTVDINSIFATAGKEVMDKVCEELITSKAHTKEKLKAVAHNISQVKSMTKVIEQNQSAIGKIEKLMAQQLWELGSTRGNFKMEALVGILSNISGGAQTKFIIYSMRAPSTHMR